MKQTCSKWIRRQSLKKIVLLVNNLMKEKVLQQNTRFDAINLKTPLFQFSSNQLSLISNCQSPKVKKAKTSRTVEGMWLCFLTYFWDDFVLLTRTSIATSNGIFIKSSSNYLFQRKCFCRSGMLCRKRAMIFVHVFANGHDCFYSTFDGDT